MKRSCCWPGASRTAPLEWPRSSARPGVRCPTRCRHLHLRRGSERSPGFASNLNVHPEGLAAPVRALEPWSLPGSAFKYIKKQNKTRSHTKQTNTHSPELTQTTFWARRKQTDLAGLKTQVFLHLKIYWGFQVLRNPSPQAPKPLLLSQTLLQLHAPNACPRAGHSLQGK